VPRFAFPPDKRVGDIISHFASQQNRRNWPLLTGNSLCRRSSVLVPVTYKIGSRA
jgi:hypothetical protein